MEEHIFGSVSQIGKEELSRLQMAFKVYPVTSLSLPFLQSGFECILMRESECGSLSSFRFLLSSIKSGLEWIKRSDRKRQVRGREIRKDSLRRNVGGKR